MSRAGDGEETEDSFLREVARIEEPSVEMARRPAGTRFGRFVLRGELGRGGMGVVYRAEDERLGRTVALKVLPENRSSDPQRRARFLREARSAAALVHRNVVMVHEMGEVDGELFIAMELVEGESLRALLAREGALAVEQALRLARGILRALGAAHARGIVHRDLKPENVMVDAEGEPKVLDFGLAKLHDVATPAREVLERQPTDAALTEEGHLLGTPGYMAPEQARGEAVDGRSDLFSFGAVLYEMLAGARPFVGTSAMDVVIATARDEPPSLSTLRPELAAAVVKLVDRCRSKTAAARPASAGAVEKTLDAVEATSTVRRRVRSRRDTTNRLIAAALGGLAVAGGLAWGMQLRSGRTAAAAPLSLVDGDAPRPRAITEWPPPVTNNPAAAAAYASALQNIRDASIAQAGNDLERAVKLDPTMAAANLRLLKPYRLGHASQLLRREYLAAASQFRGTLDARDQLLLFAAQPLIEEPTDWRLVATRLRSVLDKFPDDPETWADLGSALLGTEDIAGSRAAFERAALLDPSFAEPWWQLAASDEVWDLARAQRAIDRCLRISRTAASCLRVQAKYQRVQGKCTEYEETARRSVAVDPRGTISLWVLADALAEGGGSVDAVRNLLDKATSLDHEAEPARDVSNHALESVAIGLLRGDFTAVESAARAGDRDAANKTSEEDHVPWTMALISLYEEEGESSKALAVAVDFERRAPAWAANDIRIRHYLLYARHHAGLLDDAAFTRSFKALESKAVDDAPPSDRPATELHLHTAFAAESDVADALPYALDFSNRYETNPDHELFRGRILVMAGRASEALESLRRAAGACQMLPVDFEPEWLGSPAFMNLHAHLWLGRALEETGDTAGACAAYGDVLARWGNATPRSVTRDTAKARSRALHCEAPR